MALVIDATVGGAASNSFVTLAEAQTYMDSRLNGSLWTAASTDDQNRSLAEATRELSALDWQGLRSTSTQVLSWPRWWVPNPDGVNLAYNYFLSTDMPVRVKNATAELAFQFLKAGTTDIASLDPTLGVIERQVDVIRKRWEPYQRPAAGLARFPSVLRFIRPMLASGANVTTLVRG